MDNGKRKQPDDGKHYIKIVWLNGQQGLYQQLFPLTHDHTFLAVVDATGHEGYIPYMGIMVLWNITKEEYEEWKKEAEQPRKPKLITPM